MTARKQAGEGQPERAKAVDDIGSVSKELPRTHRIVLKSQPVDLKVHEIPIKYLWFHIENGRYADRMIRLRAESEGAIIDPRDPEWRDRIQEMLMGKGKWGEVKDKNHSEKLMEDIREKTQIVPGVVTHDGGVLDGNRRLAALMELGTDHFDAVILPEKTSEEDKWRIEAGIQLSKPLIEPYPPMGELMKVKQGIELFTKMKKDNLDSVPKKTPQQLVAETLYGRDRNEITEMMERLQLIDEYLVFCGMPGRYDRVGDRAERFKEILVAIKDARSADLPPKVFGDIKAMLFASARTKLIDNWDARKLRKAIPGRTGRGNVVKVKKAWDRLKPNLPDAEKIKHELRAIPQGKELTDEGWEGAMKQKPNSELSKLKKAVNDAMDVVDTEGEKKERDPTTLVTEIANRLDKILDLASAEKDPALRKQLLDEMNEVLKKTTKVIAELT